jgi:hypothetical protein
VGCNASKRKRRFGTAQLVLLTTSKAIFTEALKILVLVKGEWNSSPVLPGGKGRREVCAYRNKADMHKRSFIII